MSFDWPKTLRCKACLLVTSDDPTLEKAVARGNTEKFMKQEFHLFRCPTCRSISSIDPIDLDEIYSGYPVFQRKLDFFSRPAFRLLLRRLRKHGLRPEHRILDLGCGNGVFLRFLRENGYRDCVGFDPYFTEHGMKPQGKFDFVIANDVIEHVDSPGDFLERCKSWLKPHGILYVGTACADCVDMERIEPALMLLHQPFHRVIFSKERLVQQIAESGFEVLDFQARSYLDTCAPFSNYRFLDEFNRALGHRMDQAFQPQSAGFFFRNAHLFFYAFFGRFFPSADEPSVVARQPL